MPQIIIRAEPCTCGGASGVVSDWGGHTWAAHVAIDRDGLPFGACTCQGPWEYIPITQAILPWEFLPLADSCWHCQFVAEQARHDQERGTG